MDPKTDIKVKRGKRKKYSAYVVHSIRLAYKIIDANLLHKLRDVRRNKKNPRYRVFYFDMCYQVKDIIEQYILEKHMERNKDGDNVR